MPDPAKAYYVNAYDYLRAQLRRDQPPSDAWLTGFLIDNFGYDSESAADVLREAREDSGA